MKEKLKDFITNTYLQFKNNVWRRFFKTKDDLTFYGYDVEVVDYFHKLNDGWRKDFPWGIYSREEKLSYYSHDAVEIPFSKSSPLLTLKTFPKKKINHFNKATMNWAKGLIMSKKAFRNYGIFEVVARVKPAKGVWHAPLWFVSANPEGSSDPYAVLPEPDVAEVYSKSNPYKMEVKSNLHYGKDYENNAKSIGARTHHINNFTDKWVSYAMLWTEDAIEFYYDWQLVRVCTDKEVLERMKHGVYPIIGVGVKEGEHHEGSSMEVKRFVYWREI